MVGQFALPEQLEGLGQGQGMAVELFGQGLHFLLGQRGIVQAGELCGQLPDKGLDVTEQLRCRGAWRLYAEQQTGLPVDLPHPAEHRIAQLQPDLQALVKAFG